MAYIWVRKELGKALMDEVEDSSGMAAFSIRDPSAV